MRKPLSSRIVDGRIYVAGAVLITTSVIAAAPLLPMLGDAVQIILRCVQ
jgi:hypothetical protein